MLTKKRCLFLFQDVYIAKFLSLLVSNFFFIFLFVCLFVRLSSSTLRVAVELVTASLGIAHSAELHLRHPQDRDSLICAILPIFYGLKDKQQMAEALRILLACLLQQQQQSPSQQPPALPADAAAGAADGADKPFLAYRAAVKFAKTDDEVHESNSSSSEEWMTLQQQQYCGAATLDSMAAAATNVSQEDLLISKFLKDQRQYNQMFGDEDVRDGKHCQQQQQRFSNFNNIWDINPSLTTTAGGRVEQQMQQYNQPATSPHLSNSIVGYDDASGESNDISSSSSSSGRSSITKTEEVCTDDDDEPVANDAEDEYEEIDVLAAAAADLKYFVKSY